MFLPKPVVKTVGPLVGPTAPSSPMRRALTWIVGGLGIPSNQVPSDLTGQSIQPVVEMYRPATRLLVTVDTGQLAGIQQFTVPKGVTWELLSFGFIFTSSAVAGNREIQVDAFYVPSAAVAAIGFTVCANKAQPANKIWKYSTGVFGAVGDTSAVATGVLILPSPQGMMLPEGWTIRAQDTAGVDSAGDTFTALGLLVKEHPGVQVS